MSIDVRSPTEKGFFAEVVGADLTRADDEAQLATVKQAFLKHGVIVIRDQDLTPAEQVAFSRRLGPLAIHVLEDQLLPGHPEILLVTNKRENGRYIGIPDLGRAWHSDMSYKEAPALASLLYALEVPADGSGDTHFADMTAAYEALPDAMKTRLEGLEVYHTYEHDHENFSLSDAQREDLPGAIHPLVRTHPETGEKALFLGRLLAKRIVDMMTEESDALLDGLEAHATSAAFVHCHRWRRHDLLFWDNRRTLHCAQPYDDKTFTRHMHRTTVMGDRLA